MTMKIEDLIKSFSASSYEEQLEQIRRARSARTMERPVAAKKRVKKEAKAKAQNIDKLRMLVSKMTPEQRAQLALKLKGEGK